MLHRTVSRTGPLLAACVALSLAGRPVSAQAAGGGDAVISELMAINTATLLDEDGDSSDWIEIHNPGFEPVDLGGWHLTDDPGDDEKWPFPPVVLEGGGYLLVFASGKDRRDPAGELHASFRLGGRGEYVALVRPDGTVASSYRYPDQRPDISYGTGRNEIIDALVPLRAPARILVPRDDAAGTSWTGGSEPFDDSAWIAGMTGAGYVVSQPGLAVTTYLAAGSVGSLADAEAVAASPALRVETFAENLPFIDLYNTGGTGHYPANVTFPGLEVGRDENDFVVEVTASVVIPASGPWTFGVSSDDGFSLDVDGPGGTFHIEHPAPRGPGDTLGTFEAAAAGTHDLRLLFYERGGGAELELFARRGRLTSWDSGFRRVGDIDSGGLEVFSRPVSSPGTTGIRDFIETDLRGAMHGVASSAYLRIPFDVADPAAYGSLALRIRYDDGFAAYLNGVEIARRNAPASLLWDSRAAADRPASRAAALEQIDVSAHLGALRAGRNILAVHALNDDPSSPDFLCAPDLAEVAFEEEAVGFFAEPTPGAANAAAFLDFVADTKFSPGRGFHDAPFEVAITTATEGAEIRYTTDGSWPSPESGTIYDGPITITGTTVLRAMAHAPGMVPTNVDTHTYIFLADVIRQTGAGFPAAWGGTAADYEMDPAVTRDPVYGAEIESDLLSIPSMSITMDVEDLFGSTRGIYANPTRSGRAWERLGAAELILPDGVEIPGGGDGFGVNCGVRIYGGVGREPRFFKHSFRLLFKGVYGPTKLDYPLFATAVQLAGGEATAKFDTVILRAGFNNSWVIGGGQANQAQYLRDQWMRDALLSAGRPSPHGTFVHLYLNGLYWGLYNLVERPSAPFCAAYFGGRKSEWDALNSGQPIDGDRNAWDTAQSIAQGGVASAAGYESLRSWVDVENLADYMIVNFYGGNADWDGHNWYAGRRRMPGAGYEFFSWDAERTLEGAGVNRVGIDNPGNPSGLYAALRENAGFRLLFADRVQALCFQGGPLSPGAAAELYRRRAAEIDGAIVGESARWGDRTRAAPYTRDAEWAAERERLLGSYFPRRTAILVSQLRAAGLYPSIDAPGFSAPAGQVPAGFPLFITGTSGTIYYTLDGSDPRTPSGDVSPAARIAGTASTTRAVSAGAPARVLVPGSGALGLDWTGADFDDSGWIEGTTGVGYERSSGYEDLIATDVESLTFGINASVYVRIPFEISDPRAVALVRLRVKYDDGFVLYLNGEEVAARNAPAAPGWNATAAASHADGSAVVFEEIPLEDAPALLRAGANVLAFHLLNVSTSSSDLLLVPELDIATADDAGAVVIDSTTEVNARALADGEWSALARAVFTVAETLPLRVTEIMYHPAEPEPGSPWAGDDFEFVEIANTGGETASLAGVRLAGGVDFGFSQGEVSILGPGERLVVVNNEDAFASRHDTAAILVAGEFTGRLSNGGEGLTLLGPFGEVLNAFVYSDTWYPETDGLGFSLVIVDPAAPPETWSDREAWRPSGLPGGSPGFGDTGPGPGGLVHPGDANLDGRLDISDAISLLVRLFRAAPPPLPCEGASIQEGANLELLDVNGDAAVDVADVIFTLSHLFREGPPPERGARCVSISGCPRACVR